jgi:hypothetical protein
MGIDDTLLARQMDVVDEAMSPLATADKAAGFFACWMHSWVQQWALPDAGLSTPVEVTFDEAGRCVRLLFKPRASGYESSKERAEKQRENEWKNAGAGWDEDPEKNRPKKAGGLAFRAITVDDGAAVACEVSRIEYEEGSIVKEGSEKTIVSRFKSDLTIWERANAPGQTS